MANSVVTVSTSATRVIIKNPKRVGLEIHNNDGSAVLRWGVDSGVTATSGIPLAAGATKVFTLEGDREFAYWGDIYAIAGSGTISVAVMEMERVT